MLISLIPRSPGILQFHLIYLFFIYFYIVHLFQTNHCCCWWKRLTHRFQCTRGFLLGMIELTLGVKNNKCKSIHELSGSWIAVALYSLVAENNKQPFTVFMLQITVNYILLYLRFPIYVPIFVRAVSISASTLPQRPQQTRYIVLCDSIR